MNELKIGICGWGNVATGLYKSIQKNKKQIEAAQHEMTLIAGQKAMLAKSTKDISNFKLRNFARLAASSSKFEIEVGS